MESQVTLARALVDLATILNRIVKYEFRTEAKSASPTFTQFMMLHKIRRGVCHVGKLSDEFGISQPATSIMVNTMVEMGFLKRVPHPSDRRRIELHLTAKAEKSLDTVYKRAFAKVDERLSGLSDRQKKAIAKQIQEVSHHLSQSEG